MKLDKYLNLGMTSSSYLYKLEYIFIESSMSSFVKPTYKRPASKEAKSRE